MDHKDYKYLATEGRLAKHRRAVRRADWYAFGFVVFSMVFTVSMVVFVSLHFYG